MVLTTIAAFAATFLAEKLWEKGEDFLIDKGMDGIWGFLTKDRKSFETELTKVIQDTMTIYKSRYPISVDSKKPFYDAQTVLEELLQYTITGKLDDARVMSAIESDERIATPTRREVNLFLDLFHENVKANPKLKKLYIEENFKNEIFEISESLSFFRSEVDSQFQDLKEKVEKLDNASLVLEWGRQIEEIRKDYQLLKQKTALDRIVLLQKRMDEAGLSDKGLKATAIFLQAICSIRLFNNGYSEKVSQLYIKAYTLMPINDRYRSNAVLAYLNSGDVTKSQQLIDEILAENSMDLTGWLGQCYIHDDNILDYVYQHVPGQLRKDKAFQLNIANKLLALHRLEDMSSYINSECDFLNINEGEPERLSSENLTYWTVWCIVAISHYFSQKKDFKSLTIEDDAYNPQELDKIKFVLQKVIDLITGTEIEDDFTTLYFHYHYINLLKHFNENDLRLLESCYHKIGDTEQWVLAFQLVRALGASKDEKNLAKAIAIIDGLPPDARAFLLMFKIAHFHNLGETSERIIELIKQYYDSISTIDVINIANVFTLFKLFFEEDDKGALVQIRLLSNKPAKFVPLKQLLLLQAKALEAEKSVDLKNEIDTLAIDFTDQENYLKNYVAKCYVDAGLLEAASQYLLTFIDLNHLDESLLIYCEVLYKIPERRLELQGILDELRKRGNFLPKKLVEFDLKMAKVQFDYEKVIAIAQYALKYYPDASFLRFDLVMSFHYLKRKNDIAENVAFIKQINPKGNENTVYTMIEVLLRNDLIAEAIDVMFQAASSKSNVSFRQFYVTKVLTSPNLKLPESTEAGLDDRVKYSIDNKEYETDITVENVNSPQVQHLLGKRVGDEFSISTANWQQTHIVKILDVISKYRALLKNIMSEVGNPLNGMTIQQFSIDEKSEVSGGEQIVAQLMKSFGPEQEVREMQINNTIQEYYANKITFALLSKMIFNGNDVDTYFFLSSNDAEVFRIPPAFFYKGRTLDHVEHFVLDIPTIVLLFQLEKVVGIELPKKSYLIANTTYQVLTGLVDEVKGEGLPRANMRISTKGVATNLYPEEYGEKRADYYKDIMAWVKNNCSQVKVVERLEYISDLDEDALNEMNFNSLFDISLLSKRPGYNVITVDMAHFKQLSGSPDSISSVEFFLTSFLPAKEIVKARSALLEKNMVGLTLNEKLLNDEFLKRASGGVNTYSICMMNLASGWNGATNMEAAVSHIRWLMTNGLMLIGEQLMYVEAVFCAILPGILSNPDAHNTLRQELNVQFKLLPDDALKAVYYCLANAVKILRG